MEIGDNVWSIGFKKLYKVVGITGRCFEIEDDNGNIAEFFKKGFISETEYNANKYKVGDYVLMNYTQTKDLCVSNLKLRFSLSTLQRLCH